MGESIVYGIKIALSIACAVAFFAAVLTIISLLSSIVVDSVLGETLALIAVYLPFNPTLVFTGIATVATGIISYLIARFIWNLTVTTENV